MKRQTRNCLKIIADPLLCNGAKIAFHNLPETRQTLTSDINICLTYWSGMIATEMTQVLKLAAFDNADLAVVSAHCQDAVLKSTEVEFSPSSKRVLLPPDFQ